MTASSLSLSLVCFPSAELNSLALVHCSNHSWKLLSLRAGCCHCQVVLLIDLHASLLFLSVEPLDVVNALTSGLCALNSRADDDRMSCKLDDLQQRPFLVRQ